MNPLSFAGRVLVYGVFVVWGIRFLVSPVATSCCVSASGSLSLRRRP